MVSIMSHCLTRCTCVDCQRGDALPSHRQGIIGAYQTSFVVDDGQPVLQFSPRGVATLNTDTLPLFVGALEPQLF